MSIKLGNRNGIHLFFLSLRREKIAAPAWIRTRDLMVNSHTLCQLSHGGITLLVEGLEPSAFGS